MKNNTKCLMEMQFTKKRHVVILNVFFNFSRTIDFFKKCNVQHKMFFKNLISFVVKNYLPILFVEIFGLIMQPCPHVVFPPRKPLIKKCHNWESKQTYVFIVLTNFASITSSFRCPQGHVMFLLLLWIFWEYIGC